MRFLRVCTGSLAKILALFSLVALPAPAASAQQASNRDLDKLNLEQLMNVPFYTASKRSQSASDTPASVTVVTAAEIRIFGYRTLADVLQGVRGFWVNTDRDYSYLGVRGLARPGDYNTRILLLINGHRLNDNIYDQALLGTEFPLDLDLIERIEIVRGPGSSLYGTNAFFGVVNVITRKPPLATRVEVSSEVATQFARKGRVTIGLPQVLNGALFSASFYRADGNASLYYPEFNTPQTNYGWAKGVDQDRYLNTFALLQWKHFTLQALFGSRTKTIPTAAFDTIFGDNATRTTDARGFLELSYQRDFASGLQLTSRWFYDASAYRGNYAYEVDGSRIMNYDTSRGDWVGTEFNLSRPLGHRHTLTAGAEFRYNLRQQQQNWWAGDPVMGLDDHRTSSILAFYGQDEVHLTHNLALSAGLRLDHYSTFGTALSPRIAAIFKPGSRAILKYSFGHAFRAPNTYEMYYADNFSMASNPALIPETIDSHNVAFEYALTPELHFSSEVFLNRMHHLIDSELNLETGFTRFVNAGAYNSKGLQFQLLAQRRAWKAELSYTLQQAVDSATQLRLANSPLHLAKVRLQAPLASAALAALEGRFESPQTTYIGTRIPSLLNADLTISTRQPIWGFDISGSIYNLVGRQNYDPVPPELRQLRLPLDGREFRIKIARTFSPN